MNKAKYPYDLLHDGWTLEDIAERLRLPIFIAYNHCIDYAFHYGLPLPFADAKHTKRRSQYATDPSHRFGVKPSYYLNAMSGVPLKTLMRVSRQSADSIRRQVRAYCRKYDLLNPLDGRSRFVHYYHMLTHEHRTLQEIADEALESTREVYNAIHRYCSCYNIIPPPMLLTEIMYSSLVQDHRSLSDVAAMLKMPIKKIKSIMYMYCFRYTLPLPVQCSEGRVLHHRGRSIGRLEYQYTMLVENSSLSSAQLAHEVGISEKSLLANIRHYCKRKNLPYPDQVGTQKISQYHLYTEQNLSLEAIAMMYNTSVSAVCVTIKRYAKQHDYENPLPINTCADRWHSAEQ